MFNKLSPIEERIKSFKEEFGPLLIKYHLSLGPIIDFPQYKIIPDEVELALKIINKHGAVFNIGYKEQEDKK